MYNEVRSTRYGAHINFEARSEAWVSNSTTPVFHPPATDLVDDAFFLPQMTQSQPRPPLPRWPSVWPGPASTRQNCPRPVHYTRPHRNSRSLRPSTPSLHVAQYTRRQCGLVAVQIFCSSSRRRRHRQYSRSRYYNLRYCCHPMEAVIVSSGRSGARRCY